MPASVQVVILRDTDEAEVNKQIAEVVRSNQQIESIEYRPVVKREAGTERVVDNVMIIHTAMVS